MDREYLEDYQHKELEELERLNRRIKEGKFGFERDMYPPAERFMNLQKPVALTTLETANISNIWAQVPFCGSLILPVPPWPRQDFERYLFKISETSKVIQFVKDTGKIQFVLHSNPINYEGLDHLDPFFEELKPPHFWLGPLSLLGTETQIQKAIATFRTLAKVRFLGWLRKLDLRVGPRPSFFSDNLSESEGIYVILKLQHYRPLVEDIENLLVDNPGKAFSLMGVCKLFITDPSLNLLSDITNITPEDVREAQTLPSVYQPQELRFPCEIGKFLLRKLTYAAQDMRACYELMDNYAAYDLRKVQESLNEAIVTNHPNILNKSTEEFSEILDNVWNDPTIPRQIKNLRRGLPISIAAIGTAVSAFTGDLRGLLAGLGFNVGAAFLTAEIEGVSERIAKFFARSYQANVYDFKKKYKEQNRK